jgi:hypothetical protein
MVLATQDRASELWVPGYFTTEAEKNRAPSIDELLTLYKESREYFRPFHAACKLEEDYYLGRRTVPAPEGIDTVWPATAAAIINVATDHVDVNNLAIDVPSAPRSRARAERIKKFYQGAWLAIKKPVLRTAVRQSFLYGIGFLKDMFNADRWPDAPKFTDFGDDEAAYKKALQEFMDLRCITWPIEVDTIKPTNLLWDDSRARMKWVMEFYEAPVNHLKRRYPEWVPTTEESQTGFAMWREYWDEEWCVYIAGQKIVWENRHGYGHLNYTEIIPVQSYTFEDGMPQERYRGLLRAVHQLLDEEARLTVQINAIIRTTAWRTLDFRGPDQAARKAAEEYELFGGKNIIPPTVEVALSPMTNVPPDLYQQLNVIQTMIEQATFPNVIRGVRPRGVSAGFALSVLAGMGRLVFQGVADGLRHAVEQVNSKMAMLVVNKVRGRITVYARSDIHQFDQTIEPDDIQSMYENSVMVKAEAPEESERTSLLAMRLFGAGIITLYEAQKRCGIANPLEEQMLQRAEMLLNTPEFLQAQTQLLLQNVGLPTQLGQAVSPALGGANVGSQNVGGAQLQHLGEANNQRARVASNQGRPSVFPDGQSGIDNLGAILGNANGGSQRVPSGQTIGA